MNKRRKILFALAAGALAAPFCSFAQQKGKVWRIGILWERDQAENEYIKRIGAFKSGLGALGYAEGRDYAIEPRSAKNDLTLLSALAAELLALKVDLMIASGTPSAVALRAGTGAIPILVVTVADPVGTGLAASLARPGGNVTGLTQGVGNDLYTKRLDLLRQIVPNMRRAGILHNPDNAADPPALKQFESDCAKLGYTPILARVRKREDIATAFNTLQREKAQGLIVTSAGTNFAWRENIIEQAAKHRLPAVYGISPYIGSGGLISYGTDQIDLYRRAAAYADKIFKGAKPGDLPIEQPTKFEMVVNLKTAKALGIKIPGSVLVQATQVIE